MRKMMEMKFLMEPKTFDTILLTDVGSHIESDLYLQIPEIELGPHNLPSIDCTIVETIESIGLKLVGQTDPDTQIVYMNQHCSLAYQQELYFIKSC